MAFEREKRLHRCCFAGHRPEGILLSETAARDWLRLQILQAVADGYVTFITGMGMGVDLWAAQAVLDLKRENPALHLIAAEPYPSFSAKWSPEWAEVYREVREGADLVRQMSPTYAPSAINQRINWMVDHAARLIAIYNGSRGYTGSFVDYAQAQGLETVLYPFPRMTGGKAPRPYPLNLIDEIMNCQTYLTARPVELHELPTDFDRRLTIAMSAIPGDRSPGDILMPRFRDGATLQAIGDELGVSRERARQLIEKYIKRMRSPDILRFLDCGIENIPEKTTRAMLKRLQDADAAYQGT